MARFKLLFGKHVGPDPRAEAVPVINNMTGEQVVDVRTKEPVFKQPSKTYKAGQVVETDDDLVTRFGASKFQLLSGTPTRGPGVKRKAASLAESPAILSSSNPAVAPGGQVSSGFQQTTGVESPVEGGPRQQSGALDVEDEETVAASGADLKNAGGDGEDSEAGDGKSYTREELEGFNKADLKQLAEDEGIDVHSGATKDDMVKAIVRGSRRKSK